MACPISIPAPYRPPKMPIVNRLSMPQPAPIAPYGCTAKLGKLYLHISAWPWNGRLDVFGIRNGVKRVYFLTDPKRRALRFKKVEEDVEICVPSKAPDPVDTVLVLEID